MNRLDQLLNKYIETTAKAVEPEYEKTRNEILSQIKPSAPMGTIATVASLAVVTGLFWMLSTSPDVVRVAHVPQIVPAVESHAVVTEQPAPQTAPATPRVTTRSAGRTEPVQFAVVPNTSAVEKLVQDQVAIADAAVARDDHQAAATTYFNLARTLELNGNTSKAMWALDRAAAEAQAAGSRELGDEIAAFRNTLN
jgi:hypothetical protein